MRFRSATRLAFGLLMIGALIFSLSANAQQRSATQTKKATTQKATAAQKSDAAAVKNASAALQVVPEGVLGFGVVRNLSELDAKLTALAQDLQVAAPGALMMVRTLSGIQEGLDEKGSLVAAVLAGEEENDPPVMVLFAPVTDYQKFIAQLQPADKDAAGPTEVTIANQMFAVAKKGNYAALTEPRHADRLKKVVAAKGGSLGLSARLTAWAGEHDAYLVVMPDAIKRAIGPIRQGLEQAKAAFPADNDQLQSVAAMFDVYDNILSTIETEITHFGLGLEIGENAIFVNSHSVFLPNGSLAQAAKDARQPDQRALAALQAGPYVMAFDGVIPESWFKGMSKFSAEAMRMMTPPDGEKLTEEQIKKLTDAMQQSMAGVESMAFRFGTLQPGKSIYAGMSAAMQVDNAKEFMARYEKSIREMSAAFKGSKNPFFQSYEVNKVKVGAIETLQVTMDMSAMLKSLPDPNAQQMIELMVGEGGKLTAYLAPASQNVVVMAYSENGLTEALKAAANKSNSFTAQQEVATTLNLLPKDSQWVAFFSPRGMVDFARTMMQNLASQQAGALPQFPVTPPVGLGARMSAQGLETSLAVPKQVLTAAGGYAQAVQQNRNQ